MKHRISVVLGFVLMSSILISFAGYSMDNISRQNTVIFDASWVISNPLNFNCLVPGVRRGQGMHQAVWEPLFILNYETGKLNLGWVQVSCLIRILISGHSLFAEGFFGLMAKPLMLTML